MTYIIHDSRLSGTGLTNYDDVGWLVLIERRSNDIYNLLDLIIPVKKYIGNIGGLEDPTVLDKIVFLFKIPFEYRIRHLKHLLFA